MSEGDYVAARDALAENVTIQRQLGDPLGLAIALERLGELIAGRHEAAIAMTFAAAAFALRESVGAEPGPDAAPTSDHWLSRARQRLGPAEARVAWNAGLSSSTEDLITAALAVPLMPDANAAQTARTTLEHLTRREREVAALVAQGFSNQRIAAELVISSATVASHVAHILNKLAFESRAQVAAWAAENRLLAQTG